MGEAILPPSAFSRPAEDLRGQERTGGEARAAKPGPRSFSSDPHPSSKASRPSAGARPFQPTVAREVQRRRWHAARPPAIHGSAGRRSRVEPEQHAIVEQVDRPASPEAGRTGPGARPQGHRQIPGPRGVPSRPGTRRTRREGDEDVGEGFIPPKQTGAPRVSRQIHGPQATPSSQRLAWRAAPPPSRTSRSGQPSWSVGTTGGTVTGSRSSMRRRILPSTARRSHRTIAAANQRSGAPSPSGPPNGL